MVINPQDTQNAIVAACAACGEDLTEEQTYEWDDLTFCAEDFAQSQMIAHRVTIQFDNNDLSQLYT